MNTANITRNWKTSVLGACAILAIILKVAIAAQSLGWLQALLGAVDNPLVIGQLLVGFGLLFAKDAGVSGTSAKPDPSLLNVTVSPKPDPAITVVVEQPKPVDDHWMQG